MDGLLLVEDVRYQRPHSLFDREPTLAAAGGQRVATLCVAWRGVGRERPSTDQKGHKTAESFDLKVLSCLILKREEWCGFADEGKALRFGS